MVLMPWGTQTWACTNVKEIRDWFKSGQKEKQNKNKNKTMNIIHILIAIPYMAQVDMYNGSNKFGAIKFGTRPHKDHYKLSLLQTASHIPDNSSRQVVLKKTTL